MRINFAQPENETANRGPVRKNIGVQAQVSSPLSQGGVAVGGRDYKNLIEALTHSKLYQDFEKAYEETTGLPVALRPVESWQLPHHGKRNESPFCAMIAEKSRTCSACLRFQQQLSELAGAEPLTLACEFGLCDTVVPVRLGQHVIGFLQTGQVMRRKPTAAQFDKVLSVIQKNGGIVDGSRLREAFFGSKVVPPKGYEAMVKLLAIFAQHISIVSNQIVVSQTNAEPLMIKRAKEYIEEKQAEGISLSQVAKAVNTSPFYFCKMFKKATGLHFTDYVSRVRIEKAKNLLLNRNLRISEIAFEVGFQSLTHFNRVFKRIIGQSPSEYRSYLTVS